MQEYLEELEKQEKPSHQQPQPNSTGANGRAVFSEASGRKPKPEKAIDEDQAYAWLEQRAGTDEAACYGDYAIHMAKDSKPLAAHYARVIRGHERHATHQSVELTLHRWMKTTNGRELPIYFALAVCEATQQGKPFPPTYAYQIVKRVQSGGKALAVSNGIPQTLEQKNSNPAYRLFDTSRYE